jgi:hypothetical protein
MTKSSHWFQKWRETENVKHLYICFLEVLNICDGHNLLNVNHKVLNHTLSNPFVLICPSLTYQTVCHLVILKGDVRSHD